MEQILHYFPNLTKNQLWKFSQLPELYRFWNAQINVISRKDIDFILERHVLHSLAIAKVVAFKKGTTILDVGTGGGFPGIPLAIMFPDVHFHLVDSIGKKTKVVNKIVNALGLKNVLVEHKRAEQVSEKFDFVISRAVTKMPVFIDWVRDHFHANCFNTLSNGILYLKGGDLTEEMSSINHYFEEFALSDYFKEHFFETKKVVYVKVV